MQPVNRTKEGAESLTFSGMSHRRTVPSSAAERKTSLEGWVPRPHIGPSMCPFTKMLHAAFFSPTSMISAFLVPTRILPWESKTCQNVNNEVRITRYFIPFHKKLPSLCILSERSLWSVRFLIERLCSVSVPGPRASEHPLPLTCTKKKKKKQAAAFVGSLKSKCDHQFLRSTYGLSLPPVTMRPSLSVVYIVNTGPVWALATILTRMCSFHTHTSPLMVPVNVKLFWKENKSALI